MIQVPILLVLAGAVLVSRAVAAEKEWSVDSPNGKVRLAIRLGDGPPGKSSLSYRVEYGPEGGRARVLGDSPLGLKLADADFTTGLKLQWAGDRKLVEEGYTMPHGKRVAVRSAARQMRLAFRSRAGLDLEIDMRASDDGVAFRYRLPGSGTARKTLTAEATGFTLPGQAKVWAAPSDKASTYSPAYETYYEDGMAVGTPAPLSLGWSFPLLFHDPESRCWALITEANVATNFCGTRLSSFAPNGTYSIIFPNPLEGNGTGSVCPESALPWETPWRVIILGDSLAAIVESTLVTDVSAPSRVADTSWIRPGRVAWSWWGDNPSPKDASKQKKWIDLAVEMSWEYVLVDANWTIMENGNLREVLNYAKEKNVGVLLWYNSGGPHNLVTEKPRDCLTYGPVREFELKLLKDWGVKGIKVDFFQSDKQNVIAVYHGILRDSAAQQVMVNFHGCTLPRGWERTYPHLMSMEAVRGEECYIFDDKYPDAAPVQNTILPFTRNAVGPMDYTPVGLSDNRYPHKTTYAHEIALTVVFESGWLHFADRPEPYLALPEIPKQFLKTVPVAWDDTRFVDGYPGQFAVIARRKGTTWYIAGVNGRNTARDLQLSLGGLIKEAGCPATLILDGDSPRKLASNTQAVENGKPLAIKMAPFGGFVAIVAPAR